LDGEAADQVVVEAVEVVDLEEFEEVHAEELEGDAQVLAEDNVVPHVNHVHYVVGVVLLQEVEYLQLDSRLVGVLLLVLYDLQGYFLLGFVVQALQRLMNNLI